MVLFSKSTKGQIYTADFISSVVVFSVIIVLYGAIWNTTVDKTKSDGNPQIKQHSMTFELLKTSGYPQNWNTTNVEIIGLYNNSYLDTNKFLKLKNISGSKKRTLLRTDKYWIELQYENGSTVSRNNLSLVDSSLKNNNLSKIDSKKIDVYTSAVNSISLRNGQRIEMKYYSWSE